MKYMLLHWLHSTKVRPQQRQYWRMMALGYSNVTFLLAVSVKVKKKKNREQLMRCLYTDSIALRSTHRREYSEGWLLYSNTTFFQSGIRKGETMKIGNSQWEEVYTLSTQHKGQPTGGNILKDDSCIATRPYLWGMLRTWWGQWKAGKVTNLYSLNYA